MHLIDSKKLRVLNLMYLWLKDISDGGITDIKWNHEAIVVHTYNRMLYNIINTTRHYDSSEQQMLNRIHKFYVNKDKLAYGYRIINDITKVRL